MKQIILQNEDFEDFETGDFPYDHDHSAMGEYHYYPSKGYSGRWYCPITDYNWQAPFWVIARNDKNQKVMESQVLRETEKVKFLNVLTTGSPKWDNYTVECFVRPLKTGMFSGIGFRYLNSRCMYSLCFNENKIQLVVMDNGCSYLSNGEYKVLASKEFRTNCETEYHLQVICKKNHFTCSLDGVEVFKAEDDTYKEGCVALLSNCPAQFRKVTVSADKEDADAMVCAEKAYSDKIEELRKQYPQPKLWKKIDFKKFGAGRNVRFGDLTGNGQKDILVAQCRKRIMKDRYADISCITALDLDGNIIWQQGDPNPDNAYLTADLPMQIVDIDGDRKNEVVMSRDFKIMILDGATGKVKKWVYTPYSETPMERLYSGVPYGSYAFDRVNIDCIRICNFTGKDKPTDILVKDRYSRLWAYDNELNLLWFFNDGITGHFPLTKDLDGDGKEEMYVGYNLVNSDGKKLWTLPVATDHTDEIVIGKLDPASDREVISIVSGNEGYMVADLDGNILKKELLGHAQRISIGNYRPDLPGFETAVTTYWFNMGLINIYDCTGKLIYAFEPGTNGNILAPVNWTGDGRDLILLNGNVEKGGLIDGEGHQVVVFPDDGHPELCCEVLDVTGDCRDEIAVWDEESMWIYTQDKAFIGDKIYCPEKYPDYNASNYRGEFSWPKWKENI